MGKQVQHDKEEELLRAERLIADTIRSSQNDKERGWMMAGSLIVEGISPDSYRYLLPVGLAS